MRLDIRLVSTLVSPLRSPLKPPLDSTLDVTLELTLRVVLEIMSHSSTPPSLASTNSAKIWRLKHSHLLCELQKLREQLLELPISNVGKEDGKGGKGD
jgi:hypothetical protein